MDKIWSYAPNDSLMRLRCVSREFKDRADALVLDHVLYWEFSERWRYPCCPRQAVATIFRSTRGRRLPVVYPLPYARPSASFGHVPVLDFVPSCDPAWLKPFAALLQPSIARTCQVPRWQPSCSIIISAPVQIHFLQRTVPLASVCVTQNTRKLVICLTQDHLQPPGSLCEGSCRHERSLNLDEVVFIFEQRSFNEDDEPHNKDNDIPKSCKTVASDRGSDIDEQATVIRALHSIVLFVYRAFQMQSRPKPCRNFKIIFVDFPATLSRFAELNRTRICRTSPHERIDIADLEAVFDAITFWKCGSSSLTLALSIPSRRAERSSR